MINFEIYFDEISGSVEQTLYFREILVGTTKSSHIRIKGSDLPSICLKLSCSSNGILVEGSPDLPFFVNGKKVIGSKIINIGDKLKVGESLIRLKEFNFDQSFAPLNLEQLYDNFHEKNEEYDTILSAIEKELILADDGVTG